MEVSSEESASGISLSSLPVKMSARLAILMRVALVLETYPFIVNFR